MFKKTALAVALTLAVVCAPGARKALGQETTGSKTETQESSKPVQPYRLDFSVNELEDGKKINSRQYSMDLNANDANELKIGTRVPVEAGHEQFQYMDIGTNIWCRIGERPDGIPISVRAEISNFAMPEQGGSSSRPIIRQFKINASTLAQLGKPMVVGSVDDPSSKRQFQLEVTVTKVK
jgi:hypothetical protein